MRACLLAISPRRRSAFSILEVLVSLAVLLTGIVAILSFLPSTLRQNQRSADISIAAYLAQLKAEEIRRDDTSSGQVVNRIRALTAPTAPITFGFDKRFAYQFCGVSVIDADDEPGPDDDPRDDPNVARVIVLYDAAYRPSGGVLYELRFAN